MENKLLYCIIIIYETYHLQSISTLTIDTRDFFIEFIFYAKANPKYIF